VLGPGHGAALTETEQSDVRETVRATLDAVGCQSGTVRTDLLLTVTGPAVVAISEL
jgi:hypothetical protein